MPVTRIESALLHRDRLDHLGQVELLDRLDAERDHAEDDADRAALLEGIDAEAAEAGDAVGEVALAGVVELLLLARAHDPVGHLLHLLGRQALAVLQRHQRAVHAEHRGQARLQMDVRRAALERDLEDLVQLQLGVLSGFGAVFRRAGSHDSFDRTRSRLEKAGNAQVGPRPGRNEGARMFVGRPWEGPSMGKRVRPGHTGSQRFGCAALAAPAR